MPIAGREQGKSTARPQFYMEAIKNDSKSEKEGRPIFEDKEMCKVVIPGDKHINWVGLAHEKVFLQPASLGIGPRELLSAAERWPDHYAAFKRNEQTATIGTPLEQWPNAKLTKGRVAELKAANILSVEDLAGLPDALMVKLGMGGRELRDAAQAYIEQAKEGADTNKMAAELAELRAMVAQLSAAQAPAPESKEKTLEDCTDEELKEFIKRETGSAPRGTPSRDTLLAKAAEIVQAKESEAA